MLQQTSYRSDLVETNSTRRSSTTKSNGRETPKKSRSNSGEYSIKCKQELWNRFEVEIGTSQPKLECLYENSIADGFCALCGDILVVNEDKFQCCANTKCGIVYKNSTNDTAEWKYSGENGTDNSRCGMPVNPLLVESSYGCSVINNGSSTYEMRKLKKYTDWQSMPYKEKTLYDDFKYITTRSELSGIPKIIINDAMRYYTTLSENTTFRGLNRDGIIAASIYISCRINGVPRSPKEIAQIFAIDISIATKGCKTAVSVIRELENTDDTIRKMAFSNITPLVFIDRYCSMLDMPQDLTKLCTFICVIIEKRNLIPENTPHAIAGGVLYYVSFKCHLNKSKTDISKIIDISEVTIAKCFKKLIECDHNLIPEVIRAKYGVVDEISV